MFQLRPNNPNNRAPLDHDRIASILGSTYRPVGSGGPLTEYQRMKEETRKEPKKKKRKTTDEERN